jgi:hypothetical protein
MRLRAPYDLVVRSTTGYDLMEDTGVVHTLGEPGERQRFSQRRLTKTIPFIGGYFTETPDVWGLSRMSSGACSLLTFDDDLIGGDYGIAPELVMGFCKVVKGSIDETDFRVKTFCYEWAVEDGGEWDTLGWIPTDPELTTWFYELSGVILDPAASSFEIIAMTEAPDGVPCMCPAGDGDSLKVSLHLVDNLGRPLQGVPSTDIRIVPSGLGASNPLRFVCEAEAESSHVFRSETFAESAENGDLVIRLPGGGGGYGQAIDWRVYVSGVKILEDEPYQGVRSVDLNGDGRVIGSDFSLFSAGYLQHQWFADLNGDGDYTPADLAILSAHCLHACPFTRDAGTQLVAVNPKLIETALATSPNPSNGETRVTFALPEPRRSATVRVYDLAGRLVRTLWDGPCEEGPRSLIWDGRNDSGDRVGSGVYFISLFAPPVQRVEKLLLLK